MLWNPEHDKPKADPLSAEAFFAWVATQNPEETYCYADPGDCAWAKYMRAIGNEKVEFYSYELPPEVKECAKYNDGSRLLRTFGGILRYRELMKKQAK